MTGHRNTGVSRRNVIQFGLFAATVSIPGWVLAKNSLWLPDDLPLTPMQTEGPFYPEKPIAQQLFNDNDLSRKLGDHEFAKGNKVVVYGVVKNRKGKPLSNSIVEVWQACASGRYNHSLDKNNSGLLDNNFQFWGRCVTGKDGRYEFQSIIPGKYPGRNGRHIHFRIDSPGYRRCSTQCYFSDFGKDNHRDGIYRSLDRKERNLVTVELSDMERKLFTQIKTKRKMPNKKVKAGQFDIVLAEK